MSQKFQAAVQHRGDTSYVKLAGVIDEDNELGELVDKIPNGTAVIDLGEVERINSCGVRDWVNWLGKLEKVGSSAVLVECSPAIVAQINLVNNFTGSGVVKSFYVPYFCPECDEEKVLLVEAADMGPPPHEPPTCRCDECDLVMDFDDMPDSYFAFLANQRKLPSSGGGKATPKIRTRGSAPLIASDLPVPPAQTPRSSVPSISPKSRAPSQIGMGAALPGTPPGGQPPAAGPPRASAFTPPPPVQRMEPPQIGANLLAKQRSGMVYVVLAIVGVAIGVAVLLMTR
jgi:anti-anti-sigma regulatory factor